MFTTQIPNVVVYTDDYTKTYRFKLHLTIYEHRIQLKIKIQRISVILRFFT